MTTPPAIPPVSDSDRYSIFQNGGATLTTLAVPFPIYGDGTDIVVQLDGAVLSTTLYSLSSISGGSTLANLPQPITDGLITFSPSVTPTTVEIIGAIHPRQLSMSTTPGIARREFNQIIGYLLSICRELYRKTRLPMQLGFDANGPLSARASYNAAAQGFRFMQTDDASGRPLLYVKNSAASGDWSQALNFQGPQGNAGAAGGAGTVTSAASGYGLTGGPITVSGSFAIDATQFGWGFRNRLINGSMRFDQRNAGAAFTLGIASGVTNYTLDRWSAFLASAATGMTVQRVQVRSGGVAYCLRSQRVAASSSTVQVKIAQVLETDPNIDLQGQQVTLSFKARAGANFSASAGTLTAGVFTGTSADQSSASFAASTWPGQAQLVTTAPSLTPGGAFQTYSCVATIPAGAQQIAVAFWWTPTGTAGAADYVDITDVQLELGSVPNAQISVERRPPPVELSLCQRFFSKSYAIETAVGATVTSGTGGSWSIYLNNTGVPQFFPTRMRSSPSVSLYDNTGALGKLSYTANLSSYTNGLTTFTGPYVSEVGFLVGSIGTSAELNFDYSATAEL